MKTDLRIKLTQKMIKDSFLELLKEKPYNRITVKEICDKAEINRGTFYKHYYDTLDLMEQLENEAIENFEKMVQQDITADSKSILLAILHFVQNNHELFTTLYSNGDKNRFLSRLSERCTKHLFSLFSSASSEETMKNKFSFYYIAGGTTNIIEQYLSGKLDMSPELLAEQLEALNAKIFF